VFVGFMRKNLLSLTTDGQKYRNFTKFCTQVLGLELTTLVNVEVPVIVLWSR